MKTSIKFFFIIVLAGLVSNVSAQNRDLDNYRQPDQRGLNVFETPKTTESTFEDLNVRIGGGFAIQYQSLNHSNNGAVPLKPIGDNFNLATANLDLDVALADGVNMHLRTYLSSRHHPEPYVKGGYIQFDKLDFIKPGFLSNIMDVVTVKIGHMEINYGDTHFRRSDNAAALYNPFVGNTIMDAFTTEVGTEIYVRKNGFIGMIGVTNGKLNQAVDNPGNYDPSVVAKLGYDKQMNDDLRLRLTGSVYTTGKASPVWLYNGDRAGSRYYLVMEDVSATSSAKFTSGRFNPSFQTKLTAFMINPFVKYKGLEVFGMFENSKGQAFGETSDRTWNQYLGEVVYRFGKTEEFYLGGRYNIAKGDEVFTMNSTEIKRTQLSAGWFMTKNILAKIEYVKQTYDGFGPADIRNDGQFDGLMVEAVIGF